MFLAFPEAFLLTLRLQQFDDALHTLLVVEELKTCNHIIGNSGMGPKWFTAMLTYIDMNKLAQLIRHMFINLSLQPFVLYNVVCTWELGATITFSRLS